MIGVAGHLSVTEGTMPEHHASRDFNSLAAFIDAAQASSTVADEERSSRRVDYRLSEWAGASTWEEAQPLAHGWHEGAAEIERLAATIRPKHMRQRNETFAREVGPGALNMGRFIAGHPRPYAVSRPTNAPKRGKGKVVRLMVSLSASGAISTETITRRGAAIVALADALERAGRRVEIVASFHNSGLMRGRGASITYSIVLKRPEQRLNLPTLAFALAHSAMLRRFIFSAMETESAAVRRGVGVPRGGYGYPGDIPEGDRSGFVYVGKMLSSEIEWSNDDRAREWVVGQLADQGITLK